MSIPLCVLDSPTHLPIYLTTPPPHQSGEKKKKKTLTPGKTEQEEMGTTGDEMVGWHHQLDRHESEQTPGQSEGQGRLLRCSP